MPGPGGKIVPTILLLAPPIFSYLPTALYRQQCSALWLCIGSSCITIAHDKNSVDFTIALLATLLPLWVTSFPYYIWFVLSYSACRSVFCPESYSYYGLARLGCSMGQFRAKIHKLLCSAAVVYKKLKKGWDRLRVGENRFQLDIEKRSMWSKKSRKHIQAFLDLRC